MSNIQRTLRRLTNEQKLLMQKRANIIDNFQYNYAQHSVGPNRDIPWKETGRCVELQKELSSVREKIKVNRLRAVYYKKMYKQYQKRK